MYVPFDQLPDTARIWIYQASRQLNSHEEASISERLRLFTETWTAHGKPMRASFTTAHGQFIILAADESAQSASGCAIDESVRLMKDIEQHFSLQLFNRGLVTFFQSEDEKVLAIPVAYLQSSLADGKWDANSMVFDLTVNSAGAFRNKWIVPAAETWLKRYLDKVIA